MLEEQIDIGMVKTDRCHHGTLQTPTREVGDEKGSNASLWDGAAASLERGQPVSKLFRYGQSTAFKCCKTLFWFAS